MDRVCANTALMDERKPGPPSPRETIDGVVAAWRAGDALRAGAYFASDGTYTESGREPLSGRDAIVAHFTRFFRDGPRWRFDVDAVIAERSEACVVYRFAVEGAGGRFRERAGCAVVRCDAGGAIVAWREYEG
jgi:uncharacterized protein (TIGR02246 family)